MKTAAIIGTACLTLAFSAASEARTSTASEMRGYNNCVNEASKDSNGLVTQREYLIEKSGASAMYYINASRWQDGERNAVRVACETTLRGARLVSASIEEGRFSNDPARVTVEIAQN